MCAADDRRAGAAGLLLAAGGGSRIGHPKALVEFHGEPLVRRGVRLLSRAGCAPIVVVVGAAAEQVTALLDDTGVRIVENPHWSAGMGGSLRAGLAALEHGAPRAGAAVVALVDQPLVSPVAVARLIDAWRAGARIAAAAYDGNPRNPVVFDASVWPDAAQSASGDSGARALLRRRPDWVRLVPCGDISTPSDVDTAADLQTLTAEPDPNPNPDGDGDDRAPKEPPWS